MFSPFAAPGSESQKVCSSTAPPLVPPSGWKASRSSMGDTLALARPCLRGRSVPTWALPWPKTLRAPWGEHCHQRATVGQVVSCAALEVLCVGPLHADNDVNPRRSGQCQHHLQLRVRVPAESGGRGHFLVVGVGYGLRSGGLLACAGFLASAFSSAERAFSSFACSATSWRRISSSSTRNRMGGSWSFTAGKCSTAS